jgi:general nucleoside transport system permease protein
MDSIILLIENILSRTFIAGTPFLLGTVGEIYTERSGIINLGVEGMMSVGAMTGFAVCYLTGSPWLGFIAAGFASALLSFVHAFITISLKSNQIVSGLALTMFGLGLSGMLGQSFVGIPLQNKFTEIEVPFLSHIPILGQSLFFKDPIFYLSLIICVVLWFVLYKTRWGIEIRSVGENPIAANAMGINVSKIQYICVLIGGFLSGAAGAYISLVYLPTWIEGMTGGKGWIIIALTIFAGWNPMKAIYAYYFFGIIYVLQFLLQSFGVSPNILLMLPYISTLAILLIGSNEYMKKRIGAPAALGVIFDREAK